MKLTDAAKSGDRRKTLIALRDEIAKTIETCESGRDMASLSKRLMEIMDELDHMPDESKQQKSKLIRFREEKQRASGE